ncbi:hypothetical protein NPIL_589511 [Nephila pilipes]|uniref:Uncharacterized protein n=1 Tax=Nephila pilipes TaxID=299642 RepID=A0A8X6N3I3_NEPPI|nr:hypothetical protein NPIL_589511 [Nephila pilipes]
MGFFPWKTVSVNDISLRYNTRKTRMKVTSAQLMDYPADLDLTELPGQRCFPLHRPGLRQQRPRIIMSSSSSHFVFFR